MSPFWRGFFSLFSWTNGNHSLSPKERVDEILNDFYLTYPWIERDDIKALENDWKAIARDTDQQEN